LIRIESYYVKYDYRPVSSKKESPDKFFKGSHENSDSRHLTMVPQVFSTREYPHDHMKTNGINQKEQDRSDKIYSDKMRFDDYEDK